MHEQLFFPFSPLRISKSRMTAELSTFNEQYLHDVTFNIGLSKSGPVSHFLNRCFCQMFNGQVLSEVCKQEGKGN